MSKSKIKGSRKAVRSGVKKTSKRLARIAARYLDMGAMEWFATPVVTLRKETKALAASVLSQYESEQKAKK